MRLSQKQFCYEEGADDKYFELCDDCWWVKVKNPTKLTK